MEQFIEMELEDCVGKCHRALSENGYAVSRRSAERLVCTRAFGEQDDIEWLEIIFSRNRDGQVRFEVLTIVAASGGNELDCYLSRDEELQEFLLQSISNDSEKNAGHAVDKKGAGNSLTPFLKSVSRITSIFGF